MVLRIVIGLDKIFELMSNVLSFLDRLTDIYYRLSEMCILYLFHNLVSKINIWLERQTPVLMS